MVVGGECHLGEKVGLFWTVLGAKSRFVQDCFRSPASSDRVVPCVYWTTIVAIP
jgi:hypothetical protein